MRCPQDAPHVFFYSPTLVLVHELTLQPGLPMVLYTKMGTTLFQKKNKKKFKTIYPYSGTYIHISGSQTVRQSTLKWNSLKLMWIYKIGTGSISLTMNDYEVQKKSLFYLLHKQSK